MPVKSYLAISKKGKKEQLQQALNQVKGCESTVSDNKNVLVVLTETETVVEDKILFQTINNLESLELLTLVSAFDEQSISP